MLLFLHRVRGLNYSRWLRIRMRFDGNTKKKKLILQILDERNLEIYLAFARKKKSPSIVKKKIKK